MLNLINNFAISKHIFLEVSMRRSSWIIAAAMFFVGSTSWAQPAWKSLTCTAAAGSLTILVDVNEGRVAVIDNATTSVVVTRDGLTASTDPATGKLILINDGIHDDLPRVVMETKLNRKGFGFATILNDLSGSTSEAKCVAL
jgi:hypothetical protein